MTLPPRLENLARAFFSGTSGLRRDCKCGRVFYDTHNTYDWDEGEFEALVAAPKATGVPYSVEGIELPGGEYAVDCDCWHEKATKLIDFLDYHDHHIASWFQLERERLAAEAAAVPILRITPTYKPKEAVVALTDIIESPNEDHPGIVHAHKGDKLLIVQAGGYLDYIVLGSQHPHHFHVRALEIYPFTATTP